MNLSMDVTLALSRVGGFQMANNETISRFSPILHGDVASDEAV